MKRLPLLVNHVSRAIVRSLFLSEQQRAKQQRSNSNSIMSKIIRATKW